MSFSNASESGTSLDRQTGKATGLVSFKTGIVEEAKVGWAIVRFPDLDDLLTKWLPVLKIKTHLDKGFHTLDVGDQVQVVMDDRLEDGCVLGAIYSDADLPPTENPAETGMAWRDGGLFSYNHETGILTIKAPVRIVFETPLLAVTGDVTAGPISVQNHVHTDVITGPMNTGGPV